MIGKGLAILGVWVSCAAMAISLNNNPGEGWQWLPSLLAAIIMASFAAGVTSSILIRWGNDEEDGYSDDYSAAHSSSSSE